MEGLKYIHLELEELHNRANNRHSGLFSNTHDKYSGYQNNKLLRNTILPLISYIRIAGFILYCTPCICVPEWEKSQNHSFISENELNDNEKSMERERIVSNNLLTEEGMKRMTEADLSKIDNNSNHYLNFHNSNLNLSFSCMNNISEAIFENSSFKSMPLLSNISPSHLIPVIDPDEISEGMEPEFKYLLINAYSLIPHSAKKPSYFFQIPENKK